jgi:2'-hydroxyisoflavone reductase
MKLLILGGTLYLGRHTVEAARTRGHEVTLFNRGRTNPDLFPGIERLRGDREGDLGALAGRSWDAVIDTTGYVPGAVRASCALLENAASHYTFISSINVYADPRRPGLVEDDALVELPDGASETVVDGTTYGPLKARCEREVTATFAGRSAVVRAGLIVGPHDATERSAYWPMRVAEGGETLAPGRPDRPIQLVDVRDLARWLVQLAESRTSGVFNGTGPAVPLAMERFLETCRAVSGSAATFVWMDDAFLLDQKVGPYSEMPLWVPEEHHAFETVSCARAIAAGLTYRPLADTLRDTLAWARTLPPGRRAPRVLGVTIPGAITHEREAKVLQAWRERAAVSGAGSAGITGRSAGAAR